MTISAISNVSALSQVSESMNIESSHGNLANLVSPDGGDVSSFNQSVSNFIDGIQNSASKIHTYASNGDKLAPRDLLKLQETVGEYSIAVQILSKGVSTATKAINQLVSMQ